MKKNTRGFSLIELIIFIVVTGIALSGVFLAFSTALTNGVSINQQGVANALANARMNIIMGQFNIDGFDDFIDICSVGSPPAVCSSVSGYTTTSSIVDFTFASDANFKLITVTVIGPNNVRAELKTLVTRYT